MRELICDSGPLIASYNDLDQHHGRCLRLLAAWQGRVLVPEPVLGETCNFLRNNVRNGPSLEIRLLDALTRPGDFRIVNPTGEDRARAAELAERLVAAPLGYVDGIVISMAERLETRDIATLDFKMVGMASPLSRLKPLNWVLQET